MPIIVLLARFAITFTNRFKILAPDTFYHTTLTRDEIRRILGEIYKNQEVPECEKAVFEDAGLTENEKRLFFEEINQIDVNRLPGVLKAQETFHLLGLDKIVIEEFLVDLPRE